MHGWPAILDVTGKRCVVVGCGGVARRRAAALVTAGADVTVIAPDAERVEGAHLERRRFQEADIQDAVIVVAATNDPSVNAAVAEAAKAQGAWINRADLPEDGDLTVPAVAQAGPVRLAVDTGGISASAAKALASTLAETVDADWHALLTTAEPYRERVQAAYHPGPDRTAALKRLTDADAMAVLRAEGPDGLRRHYDAWLQDDPR